jgi:hypothetical protein
LVAAFNDPGPTDRSQDVQVAAGPGFILDSASNASFASPQIGGVAQAQAGLAQVEALLAEPNTQATRAGLYNQIVVENFRDLSPAGQLEVLSALDDYANALNSENESTRIGLTPGSLEARRADLAVRIAADFARQSGTLPEGARFLADMRAGMNAGMTMMISGIIGRDRLGVNSSGRRQGVDGSNQTSGGSNSGNDFSPPSPTVSINNNGSTEISPVATPWPRRHELNVEDIGGNGKRKPAEASAAAQIEPAVGKMHRYEGLSTSGDKAPDFQIVDGPNAGKTLDLMYTTARFPRSRSMG